MAQGLGVGIGNANEIDGLQLAATQEWLYKNVGFVLIKMPQLCVINTQRFKDNFRSLRLSLYTAYIKPNLFFPKSSHCPKEFISYSKCHHYQILPQLSQSSLLRGAEDTFKLELPRLPQKDISRGQIERVI